MFFLSCNLEYSSISACVWRKSWLIFDKFILIDRSCFSALMVTRLWLQFQPHNILSIPLSVQKKNTTENSEVWVLTWLVGTCAIRSYFHLYVLNQLQCPLPSLYDIITHNPQAFSDRCAECDPTSCFPQEPCQTFKHNFHPFAIGNLLLVLNVTSTWDWSNLNFIFYCSVTPNQISRQGLFTV